MRSVSSVTALALVLATSCATTTKITSDPPGATVTRESDKREIGKTPLTYESKMWIWESERLTVKAAGKKSKTIELKRSEVDALPMVGGICLTLLPPCFCVQGVPLILAGGMKLPAKTRVILDNEPAAQQPSPPPAALIDFDTDVTAGNRLAVACQAY